MCTFSGPSGVLLGLVIGLVVCRDPGAASRPGCCVETRVLRRDRGVASRPWSTTAVSMHEHGFDADAGSRGVRRARRAGSARTRRCCADAPVHERRLGTKAARRAGCRLSPRGQRQGSCVLFSSGWVLRNPACASGGIGRRAGFRCQCSQGRGGSSPPSRTARRRPRISPGPSSFPLPSSALARECTLRADASRRFIRGKRTKSRGARRSDFSRSKIGCRMTDRAWMEA